MRNHALFFFGINSCMKIQNLLEIIDTKVSTKKYSGTFRDPEFLDIENRKNTGGYSTVKDDPHDPHMVIKHNHTPWPASGHKEIGNETVPPDGYQFLAQWIVEEKIYNIHFPRIYKVTRYEDSKGQYIYKYGLEKLIKHTELDDEELSHVIKMNFDVESDNYKKASSELAGIVSRYRKDFSNQDVLSFVCREIIKGSIPNSVVKNPEVKKALALLVDFMAWARKNGHDVIEDINPSNIMYRRTGQGLQMVFSDPVA